MNQQDFTTKTELFPEETGTSFRQSINAPDAEAYFGGAAIRLKKKRPKSLWEFPFEFSNWEKSEGA